MSEINKNDVVELLKSDEIREYFENLFYIQKIDIINSFSKIEDTKSKKLLETERRNSTKLKSENKKMKEENEKLENLVDRINKQYEEKIGESIKEKEELLNRLNEYEEQFSLVNEAFSKYQHLSEKIKNELNNFISERNVYSFINSICEWKNIKELWLYTKRRIIEDDIEELSDLVDLFSLTFNLFCLSQRSERFKVLKPVVGEKFDSDEQSIKGIKTDGIIEKVLLNGIFDITTNTVVYKAVVQIR